MKNATLLLMLMVGDVGAEKQSRGVIAAGSWLEAMTAPAKPTPSYDTKKPLAFTVQGEGESCAKLKTGKAASAAEVKALKACFVATWNHVAKEATLELRDLKPKDLDGDQLRWNKRAPKGTTWVGAERSYAGQDLAVTMALAPDGSVVAVWFVYLESDGE